MTACDQWAITYYARNSGFRNGRTLQGVRRGSISLLRISGTRSLHTATTQSVVSTSYNYDRLRAHCGILNQTPAPPSEMAGSSSCTMLRKRRLTTTASFPSRSPHHQRGVLPTGFLCIRFDGRGRSCLTEAGAQSTRAPTSQAAAGHTRNRPRPTDGFPHTHRSWESR